MLFTIWMVQKMISEINTDILAAFLPSHLMYCHQWKLEILLNNNSWFWTFSGVIVVICSIIVVPRIGSWPWRTYSCKAAFHAWVFCGVLDFKYKNLQSINLCCWHKNMLIAFMWYSNICSPWWPEAILLPKLLNFKEKQRITYHLACWDWLVTWVCAQENTCNQLADELQGCLVDE